MRVDTCGFDKSYATYSILSNAELTNFLKEFGIYRLFKLLKFFNATGNSYNINDVFSLKPIHIRCSDILTKCGFDKLDYRWCCIPEEIKIEIMYSDFFPRPPKIFNLQLNHEFTHELLDSKKIELMILDYIKENDESDENPIKNYLLIQDLHRICKKFESFRNGP